MFYYVIIYITVIAFVKDNLRRGWKLSAVISICAGVNVLVYSAVVELSKAHQFTGFRSATDVEILRYGLWGLGFLEVLFITLLRRLVMRAVSRRITRKDFVQGLTINALFTNVLTECLTIYGFVFFLLSGVSLDFYIFASLTLLLLASYFPRYGQWQQWVEEA